MNRYVELKRRQEKEVNEFPMFFAFSKEQFSEGMKKLGLEPDEKDKIYSIGGGGYFRKSDSEKFKAMLDKHSEEIQKEIDGDTDGSGFIYDMFNYELANHEYCVTCDVTDTLEALDLTMEQVEADERLLNGLNKARKNQFEQE